MLNEEIAEIFREERAKRGMNYKQFGALIGVTGKAVEYWDKGMRNPNDMYIIDRALKNLNRSITLGR